MNTSELTCLNVKTGEALKRSQETLRPYSRVPGEYKGSGKDDS